MNQALEQYSVDELLAAIAAKGSAANRAATEHEQQTMRDQAAREKAIADQKRHTRRGQDPVKWAQEMAEGGLPVAAARTFAEVLAVIFNRLEAVEELSPAHMRTEKRG